MLVHVPAVLSSDQVAECRRALAEADWVDGRVTAGHQSARTKDNMQVPEDHPVARRLGEMIVGALQRSPLFIAAALPLKVYPPLFNRYQGSQSFGTHIDGAIREVPGFAQRVRTDISATLFLTAPEDYDGGELLIEDTYGLHRSKLPAGDMVLYPASSLHRVQPVTRGARLASFFWVQSMIREDGKRTLLFDLDMAIQQLNRVAAENPAMVQLTSVYHNLLRLWAEV
ncbi:MAG TPA: Fe2+-dependent dioxygenase [Stellaceae bacterium]|jgi:PKHD-type hydroxylase|nr:Fe2+-dependent dioxygenase [Stellaceae bacterium]